MTTTTTVRISRQARARAQALATATRRSMSNVIEEAIEAYRRDVFWRQYEEGIERLRQDPEAWGDYTREREEKEGVLSDGLESE